MELSVPQTTRLQTGIYGVIVASVLWPRCLCCEPPLWSSRAAPGFYPSYRRSCSSSAGGPRASHSSLQRPQIWPCRAPPTALGTAGWQRWRPPPSEDSLPARIYEEMTTRSYKTLLRASSVLRNVASVSEAECTVLKHWLWNWRSPLHTKAWWCQWCPPTGLGRCHLQRVGQVTLINAAFRGIFTKRPMVAKTFIIAKFSFESLAIVPMTEQRRRRLVVSPSPESRGLSLHEGGKGIRSPMGRWNLRRRGSTVTTGLKFAWLPSSFATSSSGTGWAWGLKQRMRCGGVTWKQVGHVKGGRKWG